MLLLQPRKRHRLLRTFPLQFRCFCQRQVIHRMGLARGLHFPAHGERLSPILADGLQHHEAGLLSLGLLQQVLVQKRGDSIQDPFRSLIKRRAEGLDSLQGTTADEDREPPEETLFLGTQEVIAPGDGVAQGLLPGWSILWNTIAWSYDLL